MTEVDVKLNKWHIAMEKLYRKLTETEQIKKKKSYDPTVGWNLACETLPIELASSSAELL